MCLIDLIKGFIILFAAVKPRTLCLLAWLYSGVVKGVILDSNSGFA